MSHNSNFRFPSCDFVSFVVEVFAFLLSLLRVSVERIQTKSPLNLALQRTLIPVFVLF